MNKTNKKQILADLGGFQDLAIGENQNGRPKGPNSRMTRSDAAKQVGSSHDSDLPVMDQSNHSHRKPPGGGRIPSVVVSIKAEALGRELILNPLNRAPETSSSHHTLPSRTASESTVLISSQARVAFESRRKAALSIAAAAAASGPRLTRAAKAQAAEVPQAKLAPISENALTTRLPEHVAIALPPCVPCIDHAALQFTASPSNLLGQGAYGVVYKGRYLGQPVAVKVQGLCLDDQDDLDELSVEAVLGASLHHPGLLRTMAASVFSGCSPAVAAYVQDYVPTHEVHMVMELMEGSVVTAFKGRDIQQPGNLLMAASVAEQVAWALDFLHSCDMLHLDVKGANVLLRTDGPGVVFAKLADFGLTIRQREAAGEEWARDRGTIRYMAPEFWEEESADTIGAAADVYALGCVLWEMAHGGAGFQADRTDAQVARSRGKFTMEMPSGSVHLGAFAALAHKCRSVRPEDRPAVRDVALELKALCERLRGSLRLK